MKFTQIRSATVTVEYVGKTFLVDPMLADKEAFPGYPGTAHSHRRWPMTALPVPVSGLVNVDAIILTHNHPDHWDEPAAAALPKDKPFFVQSEKDADAIKSQGFTDVRVLGEVTQFGGVTMHKTPGQHGEDKMFDGQWGEVLGEVCGIVFSAPGEKTMYLAGDTIWYPGVKKNIDTFKPDVIVLNSCDARVIDPELGESSIIMGKQDVYEVCMAAPGAAVIASHMDAVNHACLTRDELSTFLKDKGLARQVRIPADGEALQF